MVRLAKYLMVVVTVFGLMACAQQLGRQADGGMTGTGSPMVTIGTVTKFGSVIVNGFDWNSDKARVVVNGKPSSVATGLRLGMIVRVEGTRAVDGDNSGVANTIQYESDLIGPMNRASLRADVPVTRACDGLPSCCVFFCRTSESTGAQTS